MMCLSLRVVSLAVKGLDSHLQCSTHHGLHCPLAAPVEGVVTCTYEQWIRTIRSSRRYCGLPVSDRCMQCFLQLRLVCHGLTSGWGSPFMDLIQVLVIYMGQQR
jgi:hypothetical protein